MEAARIKLLEELQRLTVERSKLYAQVQDFTKADAIQTENAIKELGSITKQIHAVKAKLNSYVAEPVSEFVDRKQKWLNG